MRVIENIKTFLYDKKYSINIYENNIHIYNYLDLVELTDTRITLKVEEFDLQITGEGLHVARMAERELIVKGTLHDVRFIR